ncbi:MAG: hypothetical protein ACYDEH_10235 [Acidimicrobiales bacterium]
MMLRVTSLRAAHLVLWSSPILLLVLVFTVSSPPKVVARTSRIASRDAARVVRTKTTTATTATSRSTTPTELVPTTITTIPSSRTATATARSDSPSATTTAAIEPSPASSLIGGAASGALVGGLPSAGATDEVPLQGPGTWIVQSSAPMLEQLTCSGSTAVAGRSISIDTLTTCRLLLTSQSVDPVHWQIVPTP